MDELLEALPKLRERGERFEAFTEIRDILRQGESHIVPLIWWDIGGAIDYRIQNYHVPNTNQQIKKWEHVWWDPDAECTHPKGCK